MANDASFRIQSWSGQSPSSRRQHAYPLSSDRAAFVFANRERLGVAGKPLTLRQMLPLIRSTKNLSKRVANIHE